MTAATFTGYAMTDDGIRLVFSVDDPGAGRPSEWAVGLTDAELAGVSTMAQFRALVVSKLQRKVQAAGVASKLDPLVGQSVQL